MPQTDAPGEPRSPIRLEQPAEVSYWTARFGLGEAELRAIVERIGDDPGVVEDYVRGASPAH